MRRWRLRRTITRTMEDEDDEHEEDDEDFDDDDEDVEEDEVDALFGSALGCFGVLWASFGDPLGTLWGPFEETVLITAPTLACKLIISSPNP